MADSTRSLLAYCQSENWAGYDPYDGLSSRTLSALRLTRSRFLRLVITQGMKRSRINLRRFLLVPKGENPKACALFCSSLIRLLNIGFYHDDAVVRARLERLIELRSKGYRAFCWGYNFDWQGRGFFLPKFEPNIICTSFAGNALLDAYEKYREARFLDAASSAGEFLLTGLQQTFTDEGSCFSYTPFDHGQVHNANLLGAAFLARLSGLNGNKDLANAARRAVRFSLSRQADNGSWPYGEGPSQGWIDNFHTGYNLVALKTISRVLPEPRVKDAISRGLAFYVTHFVSPQGLAKYYHDNLWPIDIHSISQSIVTLCELAEMVEDARTLAERVSHWAIENMQSPQGYFYFQKTRFRVNRIPYMRWSQAWMLYAFAVFLSTAGGAD